LILILFILFLEKFKGKYGDAEDKIILDDILNDKDLWKLDNDNSIDDQNNKELESSMKLEKYEIEQLLDCNKLFPKGPHFKLISNESAEI